MQKVFVRNLPIRLASFIKLCGIVQTGGEANIIISSGDVSVNGAREVRRGRQLHALDIIEVDGAGMWQVVADPPLGDNGNAY